MDSAGIGSHGSFEAVVAAAPQSTWTRFAEAIARTRDSICKSTAPIYHTLTNPLPADRYAGHSPWAAAKALQTKRFTPMSDPRGKDDRAGRNKRLAERIRRWAAESGDYDVRVWPQIAEGLRRHPLQFGDADG